MVPVFTVRSEVHHWLYPAIVSEGLRLSRVGRGEPHLPIQFQAMMDWGFIGAGSLVSMAGNATDTANTTTQRRSHRIMIYSTP